LAHEAVALGERTLHFVLSQRLERRLAEDLADLELLEEQKLKLAQIGFVSVDGLDGFGGGHQGLLEPLLRCVKPRLAERKRSAGQAPLERETSCMMAFQWPPTRAKCRRCRFR